MAENIFNLAFPNLCEACGNELVGNEYLVCVACWQHLPETNFHLQKGNEIEQKFIGKVAIERATSFYYFNKTSTIQEILYALKYQRKKELGIELGLRFGNSLRHCDWINSIDCIVPVPLAKQKLKSRGFNQAEYLGMGLSEQLNIPLRNDVLIRIKNTQTQTHLNTSLRIANMENAFRMLNHELLANKHILLIDDVITTGSTLEACIIELKKSTNVKISIVTIACSIN
jgi:ComF family protein